jgi:hypothetical protein
MPTITIDKRATFNAIVDCEEYAESLGEGNWYFAYRVVKRLFKKLRCLEKQSMLGDLQYIIEACEEENEDNKSELADAVLEISDADCAISLIAAMIQLGGEWDLSFTGGDSEYWFWHDLHHAEHDWHCCENGVVTAQVNEAAETVATAEGALKARDNGVSVGDIARQLVKIEQAWGQRFNGSEAFFLEDFLE